MENFYLIYGNDELFVKENCRRAIELLSIEEINIVEFDFECTSFDEIMQELLTIPFLSDKKAVIINNASFLAKGSSFDASRLIKYLENPVKENYLIISYAKAIDNSSKTVLTIKRLAKVFSLENLDTKKLTEIIKEKLRGKNYIISEEAIQELIERTNQDYGSTILEIEKLTNYKLMEKTINRIDVIKLVAKHPEEKIYELTNAIIKKDYALGLEIFNDLLELGEDISKLFNNIAGKFREILYTKQMLQNKVSKENIAQYFNVSPGRAFYMMKNAEMDYQDIKDFIDHLMNLDIEIKTGKIDKKLGLELLILHQKGINHV